MVKYAVKPLFYGMNITEPAQYASHRPAGRGHHHRREARPQADLRVHRRGQDLAGTRAATQLRDVLRGHPQQVRHRPVDAVRSGRQPGRRTATDARATAAHGRDHRRAGRADADRRRRSAPRRRGRAGGRLRRDRSLLIMTVPAVVLLLVFAYVPMFGIVTAFQHYNIYDGFWHSAVDRAGQLPATCSATRSSGTRSRTPW